MDLKRKLDLDQLNDSYPGHIDPEVSLFTYDSVNKVISNDFKNVSNEECNYLAKSPIPTNCLQLIRFRGCPPTTAPYPVGKIRLDIESLVSVFDRLSFPLSPVIQARQNLRLEVGRHFTTDCDNNKPTLYVCGSRFCMIWVHDMEVSSTRAVIVNFMRPEDEEKLRLHDLLRLLIMPEYQLCFHHPMFLALGLVRMIQIQTMQAYTKDAVSLQEIENDFVTIKSAGRIETMQKLRDLGRLASQDRYIFSGMQKVLELALAIDEEYCHKVNRGYNKPFLWHVHQLRNQIALDKEFFTSISDSVTNQQSALTSIINMQDGASMKTIAIITMTFLPATFAATLFAIPMFVWSDEQGQIVSRQFWLYWAVVIPLTVTVLLLWIGWWYGRSIRREYDDKNSSRLQDFRKWLHRELLRRKPLTAPSSAPPEDGGNRTGSKILEGNRMNPYLKEFYRQRKGSTDRTPRTSHVV